MKIEIELDTIIEENNTNNGVPDKTTYWYQRIVKWRNGELIVAMAHFYAKKCMDWAAYRVPEVLSLNEKIVQFCMERGDKIDKFDAMRIFPQFAKYRWRS